VPTVECAAGTDLLLPESGVGSGQDCRGHREHVLRQAGDQFALEVSGNQITSWVEPGGTGPWQQLQSTTVAPMLDLTNPATLAEYHFTFGLRGDSGAMAAGSFEGASDP
jgi:hypothetical protein